ncbi:BACON domain-containing protein [Prevotella sp. AGR2160]|uniref:BACON domain-containing protein n=1 Tax=Prevotella sp. AGR2160 TaxID=1280674 RepID=UPI0012DC66B8|nr:BACON domain-containing protein [Prevotella sp. AGR2160]
MKHKLFLSALALFAGLAMTSCSSDDDNFVLRSDSELRFGYAAGEKDFTICTQGEWTVSTESPWLSFDMMKGTGDGVTRQKIQVMSARNTGAARRDSFLIHAAGRDLTVYCDQEEGAPFTFGKGKLSGDLQVGKVSDQTIDLPFTYGYQGMSLTLHTALSGAGAQGLAVNDTTLTLDGERGNIILPLKGTPQVSGPVVMKITADDASVSPVVLQSTVLSQTPSVSQTLLEQHFDLMLWGGDAVANQPGIKGGFMDGDGGKVIDPNVPVTACKATDDGSNDLILTMAESYRVLRGFSGWDGARIYEHPGYVKVGTAKAVGTITTPALGTLSAGVSTVTVTCRVAQYVSESKGKLTIKVLNGGTPSMTSYTYQHATSDAWATGLHLGVLNRNPKDFAPNSHHDFIYQLKNPEAKVIRVEAVDEYGNTYEQEHFTTDLREAESYE